MKVLLALAFVAVVVGVESAKLKRCKDSDACEDEQCCAGSTPFSGKCAPLSKEGSPCLTSEMIYPYPFADEVYIHFCPCDEGLECVPIEKKGKGKTKHDGFCQAPTTEAPATEAPTTPGGSGDSGEVTKDVSSEVSKDVSSEVSKDVSSEVSKDASHEVTNGGSHEMSEAPVEESQRR